MISSHAVECRDGPSEGFVVVFSKWWMRKGTERVEVEMPTTTGFSRREPDSEERQLAALPIELDDRAETHLAVLRSTHYATDAPFAKGSHGA